MEQEVAALGSGAAGDNGKDLPAFASATDAISELEVFVELCWAGVGYAEVASRVVSIVDDFAKRGAEFKERRLDRARKLEEFARSQRPDFPYLYQLAVSRLWSILETYVQEIFIHVVRDNASVRELESVRDLKGPVVAFADAPKEKQAELLFAMVSEKVAAPLKVGVGRFEGVLNAIGLGGPVDADVRRLLLEVSEIRNVVLHRRGLTDQRLAGNCPSAGFVVGEPVRIGHLRFEGYIFAAHWYAAEVMLRVLGRYPPEDMDEYGPREKWLELLSDIAEIVRERGEGPAAGTRNTPSNITVEKDKKDGNSQATEY